MKLARCRSWMICGAFALLLVIANGCDRGPVSALSTNGQSSANERQFEEFNAGNFARPTTIDNEWFPLKPGTRFIWAGTTVDEEGDEEPHSVVLTVTDLTKVVDDVRTVVCWDRDVVDGDVVETEIIFLAQDDAGAVWSLGEYPEEYEDREFIAAPCWIHGIQDARAGILVPANPSLGSPSFSQGWAPSVDFTDRGVVHQTDQETTVPFGTFEGVLVIDEWNAEEPDAHAHKFYARGVGLVRIDSQGDGDKETLELIQVNQLSSDELAKARAEALELEKRALERSADVYALSTPIDTGGAAVPAVVPGTGAQTAPSGTGGPAAGLGTEEFGLTQRELVQAIENVEQLIADCMREQGFEYVAADSRTVRRGMTADKSLPGRSEKEFIAEFGFGVSTFYTGKAPQLAEGYSPAKVGLGERNVQVFLNLSPADQTAYNRALFGENTDASFAVALEIEDFSRCGGCTLAAVKQVFKPEQLQATYYNPKDALINQDSRMKTALRRFADAMREAGYTYNHPDEVETDIRERLAGITAGGTAPVESLSADQKTALAMLQEDERRVAAICFELQEELFDPVEEQIEKELFPRDVK